MKITDNQLMKAVNAYLEICGLDRKGFIEELKIMSLDAAEFKFNQMISEMEIV